MISSRIAKGQLQKSAYDVGTRITDHFEVVDRPDDRIFLALLFLEFG